MKKLTLILILLVGVTAINAQKSKVVSAYNYIKPQYNELGKAKEAIDEATAHESTANWDKTWYYRGMVYHALYQSQDSAFKALCNNPLKEAVDAYVKALELDEKGKYEKDILGRLETAGEQFLSKGIVDFNAGDYNAAFEAFASSVYINALPQINKIDTMAIFNAAIAADRAANYDKAIEYYTKATEYRYEGPKVFVFLSNAYKSSGDTAMAVQALQNGIELWPNDNNMLMVELINYYLTENKTDEAMAYLNKAIEKDPENYSYYFAIGTLYEKKENFEKAIEYYQKTLDINPEYFDAQYNMGAVYYNKAVSHYSTANDIPPSDQKGYEAEIAKAKEQLQLALPFLEKAYELKNDDISTIQSLKEIYVRLQMYDKSKEMKARLDELQGE